MTHKQASPSGKTVGETAGEAARALMGEGYNCAQAVAGVFAERQGMDRDTILRLTAALGGGMKCAAVCGAVSGALLIAGLRFGGTAPKDKATEEATTAAARNFLQAFTARHGALTCRELLGHDISTEEGARRAKEAKLFSSRCPEFVGDAAQILAEQGY